MGPEELERWVGLNEEAKKVGRMGKDIGFWVVCPGIVMRMGFFTRTSSRPRRRESEETASGLAKLSVETEC